MTEDLIENCAVEIVQYIEPDGTMSYVTRRRGDVPLSTYVGVLELGKLTLIESFQNPARDED